MEDRKLGVIRQFPVIRRTGKSNYQAYKNSGLALVANPVNLNKFYGAIEDQGQEGSCTAFAGLQWRGALRIQAGLDWIDPSEQAQYYEERAKENSVNIDAGASMEDIINVLEQYGVLPEDKDPYVQSDMTTPPPTDGWRADLKLDAKQVFAINQATLLQDTLDAISNGHPVLFGFEVFATEWEDVSFNGSGILAMPGANEAAEGGHAVNAVSYDLNRKLVLVRNQYGPSWGIQTQDPLLKGCFWMPFDYYAQHAYDAYGGLPDEVQPQTKKMWHVQVGAFAD